MCTIDLNIDEAWGDDVAFTVHTLVGVTLLIEEELLWIQNLPITHPQVLPARTHTRTHKYDNI